MKIKAQSDLATGLAEQDYYLNPEGFIVFTAQYHLRRGYCCKQKCRHCPYSPVPSKILQKN